MSIFEQNYFVETNTVKEYNYLIDNEDIKRMVDNLHYVGTEPTEKKKIEDEKEAWRTVEAMYQERAQKLLKQLEEKDKALIDKDKVIENNNKVIEELKRRLGEK